jgi:hypothetical protein
MRYIKRSEKNYLQSHQVLTHSLTYSLTHSLTYSPTHSITGLAFVWGKIVKEWLDVLIDEKAIENNRNTGIDPPYLPLFTDFSLLVN